LTRVFLLFKQKTQLNFELQNFKNYGKSASEFLQEIYHIRDPQFTSIYERVKKERKLCNRQLLSTRSDHFPVGLRKSFTIATIGLSALLFTEIQFINCAIPSANIMERDRNKFSSFWRLSGNIKCIKHNCNLNINLSSDYLVIVMRAT